MLKKKPSKLWGEIYGCMYVYVHMCVCVCFVYVYICVKFDMDVRRPRYTCLKKKAVKAVG